MVHLLVGSLLFKGIYFPNIFHPLSGNGYQFWSGIAGATACITGPVVTGLGALKIYRRHVECHEDGCTRHGKYVVEGGVRFCERHHPANGHEGPATKLHLAHLAHLHTQHAAFAQRDGA